MKEIIFKEFLGKKRGLKIVQDHYFWVCNDRPGNQDVNLSTDMTPG